MLLRGRELKEAEVWLGQSAQKEPQPTDLHGQYILSSRRAAATRLRTAIGTILLGLAVSVALALTAFWQYREAGTRGRIARARQLSMQSRNLLDEFREEKSRNPLMPYTRKWELALLLSLEFLRLHETDEGSDILIGMLHDRGILIDPYPYELSIQSLCFSPDGKMLAVAVGRDIAFFNLATAELT